MAISNRPTHRVGAVLLGLASVLAISFGSVAHATNYDETVSGDFSDNPAAPTLVGDLTLGANTILGSSIPSGAFNPMTHADAVVDPDYFTFVVPTGEQLFAIDLTKGTVIQPMDRMFFGIASGSDVVVDPSFTSAAGLLGWTLVGAPNVGSNVLPALGLAAPAMFPSIPGATGFSGPLPSGTYTIWIEDGDSPAIYNLTLAVSTVPEPAAWAMFLTGFGLVGATMRRRNRRPVFAR